MAMWRANASANRTGERVHLQRLRTLAQVRLAGFLVGR